MPHNVERLLKLFAQIISSSPERAWLAEREGRIIGFGVAAQRDTMTFLSFLFVRPSEQASGIGRALLERAMAGSDHRAVCIGCHPADLGRPVRPLRHGAARPDLHLHRLADERPAAAAG